MGPNRHLRTLLMGTACLALGGVLVLSGLVLLGGASLVGAGAVTTTTTSTTLPPPSSCSAGEAGAAGKGAEQELDCYKRALAAGKSVSSTCLNAAFERCLERVEDAMKQGDCLSSVTARTICCKARCLAEDVNCEVSNSSCVFSFDTCVSSCVD